MEPLLLGNGLTEVNTGAVKFDIDLVAWVKWYSDNLEGWSQGAKVIDIPQCVLEKMAKEHPAITLNLTQADALLAGILAAYDKLKKKQDSERKSQSSTESTLSN